MTALLEVEGIGKRFGGLVALDGIGFEVAPGSVHAVIGPNGSGKTTLFNIVSGVYQPTTGSIRFAGRNATGKAAEALAELGMGRTFQNTRLFTSMTVLETVLVVLHRKGWRLRVSEADERRARDILAFVGLADLADAPSASLPQGQRRLLEIAKVSALDPRLMLLDEPHGGLNHTETARLIDVIRAIRANGTTVLLIEHEMDVVMRLADDITVLNQGRMLARGSPRDIQANAAVIEAYLGASADAPDPAPLPEQARPDLLEVEGLSVRYGDLEAVRGIDLRVGRGEFVSLLGNNGAGKSTTLKAIARMAQASGTVRFDGKMLLDQSMERLVGQGIALVPERRRLFGGMTVIDNHRTGAHGRPAGYVAEVLDLFPSLKRLQRSLAFSLSGGEQQMLAIGRALMSRPRLLMLDEPSLGLAPKLVDLVFDKLVAVNRRGTSVLLVEQNARMALAVSHRAYVLNSGRIVAEGPSAALAVDDRVKNAYLGISEDASLDPHQSPTTCL